MALKTRRVPPKLERKPGNRTLDTVGFANRFAIARYFFGPDVKLGEFSTPEGHTRIMTKVERELGKRS